MFLNLLLFLQQQNRPLRRVYNFEEFKRHYGKRPDLKIVYDVTVGADLMLDPICLGRYNSGRLAEINLRLVEGYYCCEHVLYCPYSCGDKNFFQRAIPPDPGIPLSQLPCPFNDGGRAYTDLAN